jgi:protein-arginine kinase
MTATAKKDIVSELKVVSLQIESIEAQLKNTFDLHKKTELKEQLKNKWALVDNLLDKYPPRT